MKKILLCFMLQLTFVSYSRAQYLNDPTTPFSEGKCYVAASLSGLDLNYHKGEEWHLGLSADAGYLFLDNWMALGTVSYQNSTYGHSQVKLGAGGRYYFEQNGVYVGVKAVFVHEAGIDDFRPEAHVGYAYFLSRHLTVQPELYYENSFKDSDLSGFGVRVGFGLYF